MHYSPAHSTIRQQEGGPYAQRTDTKPLQTHLKASPCSLSHVSLLRSLAPKSKGSECCSPSRRARVSFCLRTRGPAFCVTGIGWKRRPALRTRLRTNPRSCCLHLGHCGLTTLQETFMSAQRRCISHQGLSFFRES